MLKIIHFLAKADRFHGVWPHFLDGRTGKVIPYFGPYDDGGDLVETAFLMQGLLVARQYFITTAPPNTRFATPSPASGKPWNGTGTGKVPIPTFFTGTGLLITRFTSITR